MEPYKLTSVDDSSMEDINLPIQNEEDQGEDHVVGHIEVSESGMVIFNSQEFHLNTQSLIEALNSSSENGTIYVTPEEFSLNGGHIILTQEEGSEITLFVEDPNQQAYEHAINTDDGTLEDGLKEQGALEGNESLEFIETEEVPQESGERHVYIENSRGIINSSSENHSSTHSDIIAPIWSVANEDNLKSHGTEMLFIPNPTIHAPEDTKHRKLMQLANIAHELQSTDEKNSSPEISELAKDTDSSLNEFENSDKVTQNQVENVPNALMLSIRSNINNSASTRTIDNAISVIHTTSSNFQDSSLETPEKYAPPSEFSIKHFKSSVNESELPSEMVYPSVISKDSLYSSLKESPSVCKELKDESPYEEKTISSQSTEKFSCSVGVPLTFSYESKKLSVDMEDNSVEMTDKTNEDGNCLEDESKEVAYHSNVSKKNSIEEIGVIKGTVNQIFNQRTYSKKMKVPIETDSDCSISENEANKNKQSISKSNFSFRTTQYGIYKRKAKKLSLTESSISSHPLQEVRDNKSQDAISEYDFSETDSKEPQDNENDQFEMDSHDSPVENLDSHLVIAEDAECNMNASVSQSCGLQSPQDLIFKGVIESTSDVEEAKFYHTKDKVLVSKNVAPSFDQDVPASAPSLSSQEDCREMRNDDSASLVSGSSLPKDNGEASFYNNEEPLVKPPKKTYIRKKTDKNVVESKINIKDKIELFSGDDFNFIECDKDIEEIQNSLNMDPQKESSAESDDLLFLSNVQVSATYNRKKKVMSPLKQGIQSRSLRPRSSSSKLPLENGTQELSSNDVQKSTLDLSNSEHIPWGDVLLRTSFQTSSVSNDTPNISQSLSPKTYDTLGTSSTSPSHPPKASPVSTLSLPGKTSPLKEQQQKRKSEAAFNRLLHSSSKHFKNSSRKSVETKASIRKKKTKANNIQTPSAHSLKEEKIIYPKRERTCYQGVKKAHIQFFGRSSSNSNLDFSTLKEQPNYTCSSCDFVSFRVNNLIEHLKYCANRQPPIDFSVDDMDKRQRIRGEDPESFREYIYNSLKEIRDIGKGECSGTSQSLSQDSEDDMDLDFIYKKSKYGYKEDDVVWAKVEDRFWPGLVCKLTDGKAFVKLINYPEEKKGRKYKAEHVHTFNDAQWNKTLLREAVNFPHNDIFVKTVQTSEKYSRQKWLGVGMKGKTFFSMPDEADKDSYESINNEDSDSDELDAAAIRKQSRYKNLDQEKVLKYIIEGHVDNYVVEIFRREKYSKKHMQYFSEGRSTPSLTHSRWFGPFEKAWEQALLVTHFQKLFEKRIGKTFFYMSYMFEVWIPEAIVKAISDIQNISLEDAGMLCESDDSLDQETPSIEEIEQMYS